MLTPLRALVIASSLILVFATAAPAKDNPEYTQIGHDIIVGANQEVGEVTCIACSIRIRGKVAGEVTTVGGSILMEDQAEVSGEVTAVAGNIRLERDTKVAGGVTVVGGEIRRAPEAQIGGDVTSVGGRAWIPLILVAPFVFLGLLVALVVWLVHHFRRPATPVAA